MDVVGRDQARRGQPVAKRVTQSVRHRDQEHDQHREKDREMLARGKEVDGDHDKLLAANEYRDESRYENRFERGFEFKCVCTESENAVPWLWEIS